MKTMRMILIARPGRAGGRPRRRRRRRARTSSGRGRRHGRITLDGVLDEAAWAQAETKVIEYAEDAGIPGSGWKFEAGWEPVDPTYATLKFLVVGNQLYMGAVVAGPVHRRQRRSSTASTAS